MSSGYRLEVIDSIQGLEAVRTRWNSLYESASNASVFLSYQWMQAWVSTFLDTSSDPLFVLAVYKGDSLIACAPWRIALRGSGLLAVRQIEFLGTQEASSDYLDILCRSGREELVAKTIYEFLFGRGNSYWDSILLEGITSNSLFLTYFLECTDQDGRWFSLGQSSFCPILNLPRSQPELYSTMSSERRRQFLKNRQALEAEVGIETRQYVTGDADFLETLDRVFSLYERRWGVQPQLRAFLHAYNVQSSPYGSLELTTSYVDEQLVCGLVTIRESNTLSLYTVAVDDEISLKQQILPTVVSRILEQEIERGTARFDFLKGVEKYKFFWANDGVRTLELRVLRSRSRAIGIYLTWVVKDLYKLLFR